MSKARILVVDDDEKVREVTCATLRLNGYEVATAKNSRDACRQIMQGIPNLIIVDIIAPEIGGIEFVLTLGTGVPLIAMSEDTLGARFMKAAQVHGAAETLQKPFYHKELLEKVEKVLRA